jgi:hypothetical protein
MSQRTPESAAMTCLNPHGHYISMTGSQHWDRIVPSSSPRHLSREARKRSYWLRCEGCLHASNFHGLRVNRRHNRR